MKYNYTFLFITSICLIAGCTNPSNNYNDCNINFSLIECKILNESLVDYENKLMIEDEFLKQIALNYSKNSKNEIEIINNISKNVNNKIYNFYDQEDKIKILKLNSESFGMINDSQLYFKKLRNKTSLSIYFLKGGACEEYSILASNLLNYLNITSKIVCIPNHCWVEIFINNSCGYIDPSQGSEYNNICCEDYKKLTCLEDNLIDNIKKKLFLIKYFN